MFGFSLTLKGSKKFAEKGLGGERNRKFYI